MDEEQLRMRLEELEIKTALQEDLLDTLNHTVARLQEQLDLQQAQLRLLYRKMVDKAEPLGEPMGAVNEVPPHY
mgnify:CR=1 FL=1